MPPFAVFLLSLSILNPKPHAPSEPPKREKDALLLLMEKVKIDKRFNWDNSTSPCSWKGVFCDPTNTTVIQLILPGASLIGEIPPNTIGNLSNLLVLSLRNNKLSGSIPSDFCNLALSELNLHNNNFSGHLGYINADDLEGLDVSNNSFECWIPGRLYKFPNTSFSGNPDLCDSSLTDQPCNWYEIQNIETCAGMRSCSGAFESSKKKRKVVGISSGLGGLLLLILLFCLRKKIYHRSKQLPKQEVPAKFDGFDWDELLQAPGEVLGNGSVGTTYKQVLEDKKTTVVVKRLKDVVVSKADFESHMEVLGKMKSEYVVPLRAYYYSETEKWLVYDYMNGGSLSARLHGSIGLSETRLEWDRRKRIALSAARGMAFLHDNHVVHGNIKSSNILLGQETNKNFVVKVSDYFLKTLFEVVEPEDFSFKSDVYSFGVLLLELLTGKVPNQASAGWVQSVVCEESKVEIFDVELRRDRNIEEILNMLRIAKDCVSIVQDQRPTMQKVVTMMEEMNPVEIDDWFRQSSNHEASKGYDDTPSTIFTRDTPSTITP